MTNHPKASASAALSGRELAGDRAVRTVTMAISLGYLYMAIAIPALIFVLHNTFLLVVHLITTFGVTVALIHINATKTTAIGQRLVAYLTAFTIIALVLTPNLYSAGVYLMIPVYIFIFYLTDRRYGSQIILIILAVFVTAYILYLMDIVELGYGKANFGIFLFSYALAFVFFILYASQKERLDDQLSASVKEVEILVKRLKHEKALVELKVDQRTQELSDAQAELMASIRSLPFGFALINSQGNIVFANARLGQLLDRPEELQGAPISLTLDVIHEALKPTVRLKDLMKQAHSTHKALERNIEHGVSFFRLFCSPIIGRDDALVGTVVILEDTTAQRALDRSRDEFFSIASHELRTPLTAIRGNSELIINYYSQVLKDPSLKEMVSDIHGASIRLIEIVNDFLDMSRLEMRKIEFKPTNFDIPNLITDVLREYDVTGSRKKLELKFVAPTGTVPAVYADQDRVRQIVINLIGNALKFTDQGGITVTVEPVDSIMKINVIDTGRGIRSDMRHLLFQKFQQATQDILTRDNTRGTGLGLYISRLLAEGMKGKLYIESTEVGKDSTFTLELPLS